MKSLLNKFVNSIAPSRRDTASVDVESRVKVIKKAMFEVMASYVDVNVNVPTIWTKVTNAADVATLWYLRSDVLAFLAEHSNELAGRTKLDQITELFRGSVPESQMPRARRLIQ